ncbi:26017_t:CDS:2, partial [Dentiscutata erythropus]
MKYLRFILHLFITFITLITKSYAQFSTSSLSSQCSSAVQTFLNSSEFNACFPYNKLTSQINSATSFQSIATSEKQLISVEDSVCSLPKCSDSLISNFNSTFQSKCSDDIAKNNTETMGIYDFIYVYSPFRDSFCLKNSTGGYCVIETLENIENAQIQGSYTNLSSKVLCTTCNKAIANTLLNYMKSHPPPSDLSTASTFLTTELNQTCGPSFLDGNVPLSATSAGVTIFDMSFAT